MLSNRFLDKNYKIFNQNMTILKNKTEFNVTCLKLLDKNINIRKYTIDNINENKIQIKTENQCIKSKLFDSEDFYGFNIGIIMFLILIQNQLAFLQLLLRGLHDILNSKAHKIFNRDNKKENYLKTIDISKNNIKRISKFSQTNFYSNHLRIKEISNLNFLIYLFFFMISISFGVINTKGLCGNFTNPKNVTQCLPYSTDNYFCCLLRIENSPSEFQTCYVVEKNTASSSVIQIGKITYNIDCSGIPDFYKYFPFEEKFKPCSTSNPKSISTCTDFQEDDKSKCCLGIIKTYPDIRKCYSSIGLTSNIINYTTSYGDEITLFCKENYISLLFLKNRLNFFYYIIFIYIFMIY